MPIVECLKLKFKQGPARLVEVVNITEESILGKEVDEGTLKVGPMMLYDRSEIVESIVCWLDVNDLRKQYKMRSHDGG